MIDDELIRKNLQALKNHFHHPPDVIAIGREWYQGQIRQAHLTLWAPVGDTHMGHPYEGELDAYLSSRDIAFKVCTGSDTICADRRHRFDAIERWFYNTWTQLDTKVKVSIVKGVVVFLALFHENPACTGRSGRHVRPTSRRRNRASCDRCRRSRICSRSRTRPELPGGR